jgi:hypothetical protein
MSNFISFLGLLIIVIACLCTIALMLTGLWEVIKYLIKEARGIKNENSSNRTQKTKIKR